MSEKFSRRAFLKTAAIGAAGAALAACQPAAQQETPAPGGDVSNEPAPKEKARITFTMYGHPNMVEQMVPLFNQSQDDVEVVFERSEGQGYWEKLTAAVAAGTAWDAFRGDPNRALGWGPKGAVLDVRSYLEQDTQYPIADYIPGILDVYNVQGKIYGVPTWCLTYWMYYNKNMFDEAGIAYPTPDMTYQQYSEVAKQLTKREGNRVTQFGANGWHSWTMPVAQVVWTFGGNFYYSDDMSEVDFDNPNTIRAFQYLHDMIHVDQIVPDPSVPQSSPVGLLSDNVATQADGDWLPWDNNEVFMEKYDYLDATLCPTDNGNRSNIYWPDCFLINSKTQHPEAAYRWNAWFARDPEATAIQCKVVFPVYTAAYTDESIASKWLVAPRPKGMIEQAKLHVPDARLWKVDLHVADLDGVYYNEIGALWSGDASAEEIANLMNELGNEIMAQPVEVDI
jgi:multiple sugar transport system substrate-binding protein